MPAVLANMDKPMLKGSNWLYTDQAKHNTYDSYWKARDLSKTHEKREVRGACRRRLV